MSNKRKSFSLYLQVPVLAATLATGMVACSDSDSAGPSEVQSKLQTNLPAVIESALGASEFLEGSQQLTALGDSLNALSIVTDPIFGTTPQVGEEEVPLFAADEEGLDEAFDIDSEELTAMLVEEVFNDANYQGDGNFAIPASLVCGSSEPTTSLPGDPNLPGDELPGETIIDQECADTLATIAPLIHVESAGDGLDFDLLIGPDKDNPLSLELRSDRLSLVADLGAAKRSAEFIAASTQEEIELPETVEGVIAASLEVHGPKDVSVSFAIRNDINIAGNVDGQAVSFGLEATDPLLAFRVNAISQEASASINLKRTQLSIPMGLMGGQSTDDGFGDAEPTPLEPDNRRLNIDWKGYSTTLSLNEAAQTFAFTNIGLGTGQSTFKLDNETFFALELNPDAGHVFDIDIAEVSGALPIVAFTPELDLELFLDMRVLAQEGDEEVPASLAGESYVLAIDGAAPSIQAIENADGTEGSIKVVTGEMRISSSSSTGDIQVTAGQCLVSSELTEGEHDLLGYLESGDCP